MHANQLPRLALDPALPEPIAQLMRTHPHLLRMVRSGWTPRPFWPVRMPLLARTAGLLMIVTSLLILPVVALVGGDGVGLDDVAAALGIGMIFAGGFFGLGAAAELLPDLSQVKVNRCLRYAYEHPDTFVLPEDLDAFTAPLLLRAQEAADAVLMSQINRRGMMDGTLNSVRLRDETWQIARRLAELTEVAADYTAIVGKDVPEEFAEAYRPYDETLRTAYASLAARVEALEDYAEKVRRADRHFEVYRNVERLREHTHRFEKLRSDLEGDHLAGPGTQELGAEVGQVERQLRESIEDARQAAGYLLDPVPSSAEGLPAVPPPRTATEPPAGPAAAKPTARPGGEPAGKPAGPSAESRPGPDGQNGHREAAPTAGPSAGTGSDARDGHPAAGPTGPSATSGGGRNVPRADASPEPGSPTAAPGAEGPATPRAR